MALFLVATGADAQGRARRTTRRPALADPALTQARVLAFRLPLPMWSTDHWEVPRDIWAAVEGTDGTWFTCHHTQGLTEVGSFRADVSSRRWPAWESEVFDAGRGGHSRAQCTFSNAHASTTAYAVPMVAGGAASLGSWSVAMPRDALATVLSVPVDTIPMRTDPANLLIRDGFHIEVTPRRLSTYTTSFVAAFLDRLPGLVTDGSRLLPPTATFDEARDALHLPQSFPLLLGTCRVPETVVPRERMDHARHAEANGVGIVEVGNRVLVFASGHFEPQIMIEGVCDVLTRHVLDGTIQRP